MNTNPHALPPFSPVAAPPTQPAHVIDGPAIPESKRRKRQSITAMAKAPEPGNAFIDAVTGKKPRKAKKPANGKAKAGKKTKTAVAVATKIMEGPAKRQRSARVAPLTMNAEQALAALAGLGRNELASMQAIVALLNPLPRPARKRVLEAVASITSGK